MEIRPAAAADLPRMMEIYAHARTFMAAHGNPNQWGRTDWPPRALLAADIAAGHSYVCVVAGRIVGTFYFAQGPDAEPGYRAIQNGHWRDESPYGVIHRIAADGSVRGVGKAAIEWAWTRCPHLRMDTHPDNTVMQSLLAKNGFVYCGTVSVEEDDDPRLAYEKTLIGQIGRS